jgi:carboxymethylenebutenolidase
MPETMKAILFLSLLFYISFSVLPSKAQDWAIEQLENSPRHQEKEVVKNGDRDISCFVVYPEVSEEATVAILIHENRGLNDWARSMADQVAGEGFIVIAPDLISGKAPGGGDTPDFPDSDAARQAIYDLDPDQITSDLDAVFAYAKNIPAGNGKVVVMGFCWGGSQTFRYATNNPQIEASFVFYGTGPEEQEAYDRIKTPVYGFYGGNDNRVNATIENSLKMMENADMIYKPIIYKGAGHGFMRSGQAPDASPENRKARDAAFKRMINRMKRI